MGEVAIIAESAVEERVIALQTVKGFVDTTDTLFIVEEIGPVETARANFVAIASDASLKGKNQCESCAQGYYLNPEGIACVKCSQTIPECLSCRSAANCSVCA